MSHSVDIPVLVALGSIKFRRQEPVSFESCMDVEQPVW